jgi:hypothetical protein
MEITTNDVLDAIKERNRASEMAFLHALFILPDLKMLSPSGRKLMTDILMEIITFEPKEGQVLQ